MVLVELFTSQGCDMCPQAEENLGDLARREPRVVPVAFHVDYFNNPWKDYTDALGLGYGYVLAEGGTTDFRLNPDDLLRTLDLAGG